MDKVLNPSTSKYRYSWSNITPPQAKVAQSKFYLSLSTRISIQVFKSIQKYIVFFMSVHCCNVSTVHVQNLVALKPPSMHWLARRAAPLHKDCRNTYRNTETQSYQQKGQPLSFSFFLFKRPIASTPTNQQVFFFSHLTEGCRVLLYSLLLQTNHISAFKTSPLLNHLTDCTGTWHTAHTGPVLFLVCGNDGNPSNDWLPSVKNTACGQSHFKKTNKNKKQLT